MNDSDNTESKQSILELSHEEARAFFLKPESYCSIDLPPYFTFGPLLDDVYKELEGKQINSLISKPRDHDNVNYTILNNKDGRYAWRPFQLIHPVLYVSLVKRITEPDNWDLIIRRFSDFASNPKIRCVSLPIRSQTEQKDRAEQVANWWHEVEQYSIELALEYDYLLETDITDCYGAIYTHSVSWALHSKEEAKSKRNDQKLIGNVIDGHIQDMRHGQTNGIPQGSTLMDFVAEMVLGFADLELSQKVTNENIDDYLILRYRDDYRIFTNNPRDGEQIAKLLTEVTISLGLKLNPAKTRASDDVVRASIKEDKVAWLTRKQSEKSIQKHLLIIHDHSIKHPNSGSLSVALNSYYNRLSSISKTINQPLPLISITVDIAFRNPRTYAVCAAILSQLTAYLAPNDKRAVFKKIQKKFSKIPNTGHLQIWLQRASISEVEDIGYTDPLCRLVSGQEISIWGNEWIRSKTLRNKVSKADILDKEVLQCATAIIPSDEFELFTDSYSGR